MSERQKPATQQSGNKTSGFYLGPVATVVTDSDTGSWRVEAPECDEKACIRCGICVKFCPANVIELEKGKALAIDMRFCKGCGICSQVCPRHCITMKDNGKAAVK
jgi:2-oxoacid:acceptor oxidoreductase delta subunit (pyruvate/2-ketoisovalerate family)